MVFAHGYGCDQNMWRFVAAKFEADYQVILFDYVGAGGADLSAYTPERYSTLDGYVNDVLEICGALDLHDVIFVGHSVSAMIGALAAIAEPERFAALVFIGPSPRYIDDDSYVGGFAAVIMGNPDRPELGEELTASFCRTDPEVARRFARVTFLSDNRADLARVQTPTLILQCTNDAIAPRAVGEYVSSMMPTSTFVVLEATGHCPHLSAPDATVAAIAAYLRESNAARV